MGLTEDKQNGECCFICDQYFKDDSRDDPDAVYAHGYPVVCWGCHEFSHNEMAGTLPRSEAPIFTNL